MRRSRISKRLALSMALLASAALVVPLASQASAKKQHSKPGRPIVSTGPVTHVHGSSGLLTGAIYPRTAATTYHFQYGPTVAYGAKTTPASLPAGTAKVAVGQTATNLLVGYHYRLVATNSFGTSNGKDRVFSPKKKAARIALPKHSEPTVFGRPFILSGTVSGTGNAKRQIVLQASPFPYLEAFSNLGVPIVTDAAGAFSFRVPSLLASTQFRVTTLDPRPVISRVVTEQVAVRVKFKVRSAGRQGLVRLYGTVTPAEVGARVLFQLQKTVRPKGKSQKTTTFAAEFTTVVKAGTKTISRFSVVENIRHAGHYRAFVQLPHKKGTHKKGGSGALISGSSQTILLKAAPASKLKAQQKKH
jgi:hypothetical protein